MKRRAGNTVETTSEIVTQTRTGIPDAILISLPTTDALSKIVRRIRSEDRGIENDNAENFEIPQHLKSIERINDHFQKETVPFLLHDSFDPPPEQDEAAVDDEFMDAQESLNELDNSNNVLSFNESNANVSEDEHEAHSEADDEDEEGERRLPRILIFGTTEGLIQLRNSTDWFGDGTFDVCPTIFNQLFTLHARYIDTK